MDKTQQKKLKQQAHHLNSVVMIGDKGVTDNVIAEINRALDAHELIKIKIAAGDREAINAVGESICQQTSATLINRIGKVIVIYRQAAEQV